jgi:hypothetical protein
VALSWANLCSFVERIAINVSNPLCSTIATYPLSFPTSNLREMNPGDLLKS